MSTTRTRCLLACLGLGIFATLPALAAQNPDKAAEKAAKRAAFLRGDASSKSKPVTAPRNEREALATKRVLANGIVEMQLPEDRMLELFAVKRADGTVEVSHSEKAPVRVIEEARQ